MAKILQMFCCQVKNIFMIFHLLFCKLSCFDIWDCKDIWAAAVCWGGGGMSSDCRTQTSDSGNHHLVPDTHSWPALKIISDPLMTSPSKLLTHCSRLQHVYVSWKIRNIVIVTRIWSVEWSWPQLHLTLAPTLSSEWWEIICWVLSTSWDGVECGDAWVGQAVVTQHHPHISHTHCHSTQLVSACPRSHWVKTLSAGISEELGKHYHHRWLALEWLEEWPLLWGIILSDTVECWWDTWVFQWYRPWILISAPG